MPFLRRSRSDLLALMALTLAVLAIYARVLFTPLVPASGDFLTYFAPYWELFNHTVRAGHLPLWNDYIYAGAPFQANPQTQVFYPLRWLMLPLSAEKGIVLTAALHTWLAGVLAYFLMRQMLREDEFDASKRAAAALVGALIVALNGWGIGLLLHPNQISTYPWLLAALLLWEKRPEPGRWPHWTQATRRWFVMMTLVWSMAFLAGHTQSFYNAVVIFSLWLLINIVWRKRYAGGVYSRAEASRPAGRARIMTPVADAWPVALLALATTGLVTAIQLLPTLELSQLSYRQGGLALWEHGALSLPPWRIGFTLLPHYARDLGAALGTEAYGEWLAYVGLTGLILAFLGLRHPAKRLRVLGAFLALAGLILAFGIYDPLELLLYHLAPGWNLFRVPARFLQMTGLGLALLATLGASVVFQRQRNTASLPDLRSASGVFMMVIVLVGIVLAAITRPNLPTLLGWSVVVAFFLLVWRGAFMSSQVLQALLPLLLFLELYAASGALPIQHPTAPQALRSWRTAPARLAAELGPPPHARACRMVSLSPITWDPGDLQDLHRIYGPYLDDRAMNDLVNATKLKEVIAPNLGEMFDIPSLDGFGGGVLPTKRFVMGMRLFVQPEQIVEDGRLREQLDHVPDTDLLSLFNVCYVIIGKNFDVWHDDFYYDLAFGESLDQAQPTLTITDMPGFPASGMGVVSHLSSQAASMPVGERVAEVEIVFFDGSSIVLPLRVGIETSVGQDKFRPATAQELPSVRWPHDAPGQDAIAELDFPAQHLPQALGDRRIKTVDFRLLKQDVSLFIRGLTIYDRESHAHASPIVTRSPWQRIHSGDVKIYRNGAVLPRIFPVQHVEFVDDLDQAVEIMRAEAFQPAKTAVLEARYGQLAPQRETLARVEVHIDVEQSQQILLHYRAEDEALLMIADAWHPGWRAILDPNSSQARMLPTIPADIFLRGVPLPAGEHELMMWFEPRSLLWGALISLFALAGLIILWLLPQGKD